MKKGIRAHIIIAFWLICAGLAGTFSPLQAQQSLMSRNLRPTGHKENYGMNLLHFVHLYGGLGMIAGPSENEGGRIIYGVSLNPEVGGRYKLRVSRHHAFGADLSYTLYSYKISQKPGKTLPDTILHKAERFIFSKITLGIYHRYSFGRVGNYIGRFLDIGVYGDWIHYSDHYFRNRYDDGLVIRSHVSGLDYIRNFQYGAYMRFGITRYAFFARYRISDYFAPSAELPELPRFTMGIQVGLHKVN